MRSINRKRIGLVLLIVAGFGAAILTSTGQSSIHHAGGGSVGISTLTPTVSQQSSSRAKHKSTRHAQSTVYPVQHSLVDSLSQTFAQVKRVMILSTQKAGVIGKYEGHTFDNPADNVFTIQLDHQPAASDKVFLTYQLTGISHYSGVSCSVNDRLAMGGYLAKKSTETTFQRIQLHASWFKKGDNRIMFSLPAEADFGCKISDLSLEIEHGVDTNPVVIHAPSALLNGKAYIHGYLAHQSLSGVRTLAIDGAIVKVHDGEFETIVSTTTQMPVSIIAQDTAGTPYSTTLLFATNEVADAEFPLEKQGVCLSQAFNVGEATTLGADNVLLKVTEQALKSTQQLSVTALRDVDLPALDMGMNNVTAAHQGYRFLPHGEHFNAGATVSLKYDRTKIPTGYTENDIRTYYFDNDSRHWVALDRDTLDKSLCMVVSKTTHFTDMINGIIKVPESPQTQGFTPTMMNDIKIADPASKIQVIAPPTPNNTGSANLNYHIEVPPARNGMSPDLNISYNSDGGSGWLGEGWDLNVSSIKVDTRWGVPRYDLTKETETYSMDGMMLGTYRFGGDTTNYRKVHVPHSVLCQTETYRLENRLFYPRIENNFSRIERIQIDYSTQNKFTQNYYWLVTDKKGTKYYYGRDVSGFDDATLSGSVSRSTKDKTINDNVMTEWRLKRVEDLHGDYVQYNYETDNEVIGDPSDPTKQLTSKAIYLSSIVVGESKVSDALQSSKVLYRVYFYRGSNKQKKSYSARYGFLTSNFKLLDSVKVLCEGKPLRKYAFKYQVGQFNVDLLQSITQYDDLNKIVSFNQMNYFDDLKSNNSNNFKESISIEKCNYDKGFLKNIPTNLLTQKYFTNGSSIGSTSSNGFSSNLYLGLGWGSDYISNQSSVGLNIGYGESETNVNTTLIDMNGDGLVDQVYLDDNRIKYKRQNFETDTSPTTFDAPIELVGAPSVFSKTKSTTVTGGGDAKLYSAAISVNGSFTNSKTSVYFSDVNNDGLVDIVQDGIVYFNLNGINFSTSSEATLNPITNSRTATATGSKPIPKSDQNSRIASVSPLQDVVRMWEAPYNGKVDISGVAKLLDPVKLGLDTTGLSISDGVYVTIEKNGVSLLRNLLQPNYFLTGTDMNVSNLFVNKGDEIVFRLQSGIDSDEKYMNGFCDIIKWNPKISYSSVKVGKTDLPSYLVSSSRRIPNGLQLNFDPVSDFLMSKYGVNQIDTTNADISTIKFHTHFEKPQTIDEITLNIYVSNDSMVYNADSGKYVTNTNFINKQLVFTQKFDPSSTFNGHLFHNVFDNSSIKGRNFYFEISSNTNEDWQKLKWRPEIGYYNKQKQKDTVEYAGVKYCVYTKELQAPDSIFYSRPGNDNVIISFNSSGDFGDLYIRSNTANGYHKITYPYKDKTLNLGTPINGQYLQIVAFTKSKNDFYIPLSCNISYTLNAAPTIIPNNNKTKAFFEKVELKDARIRVLGLDEFTGLGTGWKGWRQFEFNANTPMKSQNPIDIKSLQLPVDSNNITLDKIPFFPIGPDLVTKTYWKGLNDNILIKGDTIISNRLNARAIQGSVSERLSKDSKFNASKPPIDMAMSPSQSSNKDFIKNDAPILETQNNSYGGSAGAQFNIGTFSGVGPFLNFAFGTGEALSSYIDMNGDGVPDNVIKSNSNEYTISYTNPKGYKDDEIYLVTDGVHNSSSTSYGGSSSCQVKHAVSMTTAATSTEKSDANSSTSARMAETSIGGGKNIGFDDVKVTYIDMNGDGLPDKVIKDKDVLVYFNLGYSFSTTGISWGNSDIQHGYATASNLGGGLGLDIQNGSFKSGLGFASSESNTSYILHDMNGDGLPDIVKCNSNVVKDILADIIDDIYSSVNIVKNLIVGKETLGKDSRIKIQATDINPTELIENIVSVSFNTGSGFASPITWLKGKANDVRISKNVSSTQSFNRALTVNFPLLLTGAKLVINPSHSKFTTLSTQMNDIKDFDGDGYADLITSQSGSDQLKVTRSNIGKTNKLKQVTNSLGGSFYMHYKRSYPTTKFPCGKWIMDSLRIVDGIAMDGPNQELAISYSEGYQDRNEKEFLGFSKVVLKFLDPQKNELRTVENSYLNNTIYDKGLLEYSALKANNSIIKSDSSIYLNYLVKGNTFSPLVFNNVTLKRDTNTPYFEPYIAYRPLQTNISYQSYNNKQEKTSITEYEYFVNRKNEMKSYGELKKISHAEAGLVNYNVEYSYSNNVPCVASKNVHGVPTKIKVSGSSPDGQSNTIYRHISAEYNHFGFPNHMTSFVDSVAGVNSMKTSISYDSQGNVIKITFPTGQYFSYKKDSKFNMYDTQITDAFGYTTMLDDYDYRYGMPLKITDINGNVTTKSIDNLGRVTSVTLPNEIAAGLPYTIKMQYNTKVSKNNDSITMPATATTIHYDPANKNNSIYTVNFVDGYGRSVMTKKDVVINGTSDSILVSGINKYDALGRKVESYNPITQYYRAINLFTPTFGKFKTKYAYDALDRITQLTLPNNAVTNYAYFTTKLNSSFDDYLVLVSSETDPMNNITRQYTNYSNYPLKTTQLFSKKQGGKDSLITRYNYNTMGQMDTITDATGNKTIYQYDMAGRKVAYTHPASGTTRYHYDKTGNMVSKVTAMKDTILYGYNYDRLETITYPRHTENNVKYVYGASTDASGFNRKGRLAYQEDGSGTQEFKYGRMGELVENIRTLVIPNQATATYTTKWEYDSWDRLMSMTYPDGEKLTYGYNTGGQLTSITGASPYLTDVKYDKYEQRTSMTYGNGAVTTYQYNDSTRNLRQLSVKANNKDLINNAYTYDKVNNITAITGTKLSHVYGYDDLYRLTSATGSYTDGSKSASYTLGMQYDRMYNPARKTLTVTQQGMQFAGRLSTGSDLTFNMAANSQQIANIAESNYRDTLATTATHTRSSNTKDYTYDANGNLLTVISNSPSGAGGSSRRGLLWDEENHLLGVNDNGYVSTYWYDAAGERTVKQSGDALSMAVNGTLSGASTGTTNFTAYVNPYTVINNGNQMSKHIYMGTQRILSKLSDAGTMADPTKATMATYTGSTLKYADKYTTLTKTVKARYDSLGVAYNGVDNNGVGFYKASSSTPSGAGGSYYYHSDQLGSANYITDANGDVAQHLEYIPYGETFVDERYNTWHSPYLFSGKERDEETGLTYYGARYFDGNVWLSVDPLAHKYPNVSSYVYCHANPTNRIDPDGKSDFQNNEGKTVKHIDDKSNAVFKQTGKGTNLHYELNGYDSKQGGENKVTKEAVTSAIQEQQNLNMTNPSLQQGANGETHCNQATQNILQTVASATGDKSILVTGTANNMIPDLGKNESFKSVDQKTADDNAKNGGLSIVGYRNPKGHGHVLTYSVGDNINKGKVANIGTRKYTGFTSLNGSISKDKPKSYFILKIKNQ